MELKYLFLDIISNMRMNGVNEMMQTKLSIYGLAEVAPVVSNPAQKKSL
jgi:hypothetical protein